MKRLLQWGTGMILFLASCSQIQDLLLENHTWYYNTFFGMLYIISSYIGLTLLEKSLK